MFLGGINTVKLGLGFIRYVNRHKVESSMQKGLDTIEISRYTEKRGRRWHIWGIGKTRFSEI